MSTHLSISQPTTISQAEKLPSLLVIGYGNPTRGDDAIGSQVTNLLKELELQNVEVCAVEQLMPELSPKLAAVDYAIFVHGCCLMERENVKVSTLEACGWETAGSSVPGWGNSYHPCSLLALTHSFYGHHPQSWLVKVAAQDFVSGHHLSHRANQSIENALEQILALIRQCIST